jgi:hypothetical protein
MMFICSRFYFLLVFVCYLLAQRGAKPDKQHGYVVTRTGHAQAATQLYLLASGVLI